MTVHRSSFYRSPAALLVESEDISDDELRAFAGRSADFYLARWRPLRRSGRSWSRFHVPAFLFTSTWCFYRRMYLAGLALFVAGLFSLVLGMAAIAAWVYSDTDAVALLLLSNVAVSLLFAPFANYVYYQRALRCIEEARRYTRDPAQRLERIREAGGTRVYSMCIFLGVLVAMTLAFVDTLTRIP